MANRYTLFIDLKLLRKCVKLIKSNILFDWS